MSVAGWAEAIKVDLDEQGMPARPDIGRHIRLAAAASPNLMRSQIVRGLKEAYAPFAVEAALREVVDGILDDLVRLGELTEFQSHGGAGYVATPPRWVDCGDGQVAILGASALEPVTFSGLVRRVSLETAQAAVPAPQVSLTDEVGPPAWRLHLVEQGGRDAPNTNPTALFIHLGRMAAGGERLENLAPDAVRALSGRGTYFGRERSSHPEGRWEALGHKGVFCAVRHVQYGWRPCIVVVGDEGVTAWETRDWDLWRWAVVGQTLSLSDPVVRWLDEEGIFLSLTPPPFQLSRLLDLAGTREGAWRWRVSKSVAADALRLLGALDQ